MGYTHYLRRPKEFEVTRFTKFTEEFKKTLTLMSEFCTIVGPDGNKPEPIITPDLLAFNGPRKCGHRRNDSVVIPWPTEDAQGADFNNAYEPAGHWFAGASLSTRVCNGDCSYESFVIERAMDAGYPLQPDKKGLYFSCCKTAFRPYDIAVTVALLLLKTVFEDEVVVTTDGDTIHWLDAQRIVRTVFQMDIRVRADRGEILYSILPSGVERGRHE